MRISLLNSLAEQSAALEEKLVGFKTRAYPSPGLGQLLDDVIKANVGLRRLYLNETAELEAAGQQASQNTTIISAVHLFLRILIPMAGYIEETELREHPAEIMIPVRRILALLDTTGGGSTDVLTGPRWAMNFSFNEVWLRQATLLNKLLGLGLVESRYVVFTFPAWQKDNVLLNCIIGHELGHNIDREMGISEVLLAEVTANQQAKELLTGSDWFPSGVGNPYQLNERLLTGLLKQWIGELVADAVGIILFGPAFYYAGLETDLIVNAPYRQTTPSTFVDVYSWSHPRPSVRNLFRTRLLDKRGFLSLLPEAIRTDIEDRANMWTAAQNSQPQVTDVVPAGLDETLGCYHPLVPSTEWYFKCDEMLRGIEDRIVEQVDISLPKTVKYSIDKYSRRVDLLADCLGYLIPPCELNGDVDFHQL